MNYVGLMWINLKTLGSLPANYSFCVSRSYFYTMCLKYNSLGVLRFSFALYENGQSKWNNWWSNL